MWHIQSGAQQVLNWLYTDMLTCYSIILFTEQQLLFTQVLEDNDYQQTTAQTSKITQHKKERIIAMRRVQQIVGYHLATKFLWLPEGVGDHKVG